MGHQWVLPNFYAIKNRLVALDQKLIFFNILLKEKTLSSYVTEGVALNRLGIMVVQSELKNNKN